MTQIAYRATLSNAMWPQRAKNQSRTVVSPAYESLSSRKAELSPSEERDIISPQVFYVENCLPTNYGFQSVGYQVSGTPVVFPNSDELFIHAVRCHAAGAPQVIIAVTNYGEIYLLLYATSTWQKSTVSAAGAKSDAYNITAATVNNRIIVHVAGVNRYEYDLSLTDLKPVTFTGLETTPLLGIFSTATYLGAWDDDTVYWGAFEDPTDFVPSEITGAGNGVVQAASGKIVACVPTTLGFMIYCEGNTISALATSRADEPFTLREVAASGGVSSIKSIVVDWNSILQYAWTTSGLQQISNTDAKVFVGEFSSMIDAGVIDYLSNTGDILEETWSSGVDVQVAVIRDRYLCVSYKHRTSAVFQWCFVYDFYMKRGGKLRRDHTQILDYYSAIGLLSPMGAVETVMLEAGRGVIALGKYQHIRQRMLMMDSVEIESGASDTQVSLSSALDGLNKSSYSLGYKAPGTQKTYFSSVGINHCVLITGTFALNSVILHYHIHGRA